MDQEVRGRVRAVTSGPCPLDHPPLPGVSLLKAHVLSGTAGRGGRKDDCTV